MPKHEAMTPKAIAKRIKSKGLQKLRWYCQMCEKQCRDANGFKCHVESESHQRQMSVFSSRPKNFLDRFSKEFDKGFMDILSRRFASKRIAANRVYNEYISDKHHIHMNATSWVTLSAYCKFLGSEGRATIEETPKGWFLTYINRDPEVLARQAKEKARERSELDAEEKEKRRLEKRILEAQKDDDDDDDSPEQQEFIRDELSEDKIRFSLASLKNITAQTALNENEEIKEQDLSEIPVIVQDDDDEEYKIESVKN